MDVLRLYFSYILQIYLGCALRLYVGYTSLTLRSDKLTIYFDRIYFGYTSAMLRISWYLEGILAILQVMAHFGFNSFGCT